MSIRFTINPIMKGIGGVNLTHAEEMNKAIEMISDNLPGLSDDFLREMFTCISVKGEVMTSEKLLSPREQGNVMAAYCFRNTSLEDIHASETELNEDSLNELLVDSVERMVDMIQLKNYHDDKETLLYKWFCLAYHSLFCRNWVNSEIQPDNIQKSSDEAIGISTIHNSSGFADELLRRLNEVDLDDTMSRISVEGVSKEKEAFVLVMDCFIVPLKNLLFPNGKIKDARHLSDDMMMQLNIQTSERMTEWLLFRDNALHQEVDPFLYLKAIQIYADHYSNHPLLN